MYMTSIVKRPWIMTLPFRFVFGLLYLFHVRGYIRFRFWIGNQERVFLGGLLGTVAESISK